MRRNYAVHFQINSSMEAVVVGWGGLITEKELPSHERSEPRTQHANKVFAME